MRAEDIEDLKKMIGKKVVDVRAGTEDSEDYGFDLVFDDGTVLELYDLKPNGGLAWTIDRE